MKCLATFLVRLALVLIVLVGAAPTMGIAPTLSASPLDSAANGGWIDYYDENWNLVGEWYKPCSGQASRWGVVGVNVDIVEFYSCEGGPEPPDCIPVIISDNQTGYPPGPSLVCGE